MNHKTYRCELCYRTVDLGSNEMVVPECCGKPMTVDLPVCTLTDTAEHARFEETGEPCDDGRAGHRVQAQGLKDDGKQP